MSGWIKVWFMVQFLFLISSCSLLGRLGLGGEKECADGVCETQQVLNNRQLKQNWHCYGVPEDRSWDCVSAPQAEKIATIIPSPSPAPIPVTETELTPRTSPAVPIEAEVELTPAPAPVDIQDSASTILDQPADHYTVQLIALQQEEHVFEYGRQNGLDNLLYAQIESQGSSWFVLLLGFYADQSSAEKASLEFVGTRTLKVRPWVRKLAPLQEAIMSSQQR